MREVFLFFILTLKDTFKDFRFTVNKIITFGLEGCDKDILRNVYSYIDVEIFSYEFSRSGFLGKSYLSVFNFKKK